MKEGNFWLGFGGEICAPRPFEGCSFMSFFVSFVSSCSSFPLFAEATKNGVVKGRRNENGKRFCPETHDRARHILCLARAATRFADGRQALTLCRSIIMADKDLNARGAENRTEGAAKELEGKARGKVGDATDNESEQIKGKAQELKGKAQQTFGKGQQKLDNET
jgi:uncharacterized protein YjbJ (UPF0337 family)